MVHPILGIAGESRCAARPVQVLDATDACGEQGEGGGAVGAEEGSGGESVIKIAAVLGFVLERTSDGRLGSLTGLVESAATKCDGCLHAVPTKDLEPGNPVVLSESMFPDVEPCVVGHALHNGPQRLPNLLALLRQRAVPQEVVLLGGGEVYAEEVAAF